MPSDEALAQAVTLYLSKVDLTTTTLKAICLAMNEEFASDVSSVKKEVIKAALSAFVEAHVSQEKKEAEARKGGDDEKEEEELYADEEEAAAIIAADDEGEEEEEDDREVGKKKKRPSGGFAKPMQLAPDLAAIVGGDQMPRTQVTKRLWEYIKTKGLQDPRDKRKILNDEALQKAFKVKTMTMFNMNKHMTKLVWPIEEEEEEEEDEDEEDEEEEGEEEEEEGKKKARTSKSNRAKSSSRKKKPATSTEVKKGGGGFNKPLRLSDSLADMLGFKELSRGQTTKEIWRYIREHDLQNPNNKKEILLDAKMKICFGQDLKSFDMFQMAKHVSKHFVKDE